ARPPGRTAPPARRSRAATASPPHSDRIPTPSPPPARPAPTRPVPWSSSPLGFCVRHRRRLDFCAEEYIIALMSAISGRTPRPAGRGRAAAAPREDDPRVVRTRAAVAEAATTLFLRKGYAGTTMEEIAALAGIAKRTLYNNYTDKAALFTQIVADVMAYAEAFARGLGAGFAGDMGAAELPAALHDLGRRLALAILRPEVIALRRLLIGEARTFPELAKEYYDRAP